MKTKISVILIIAMAAMVACKKEETMVRLKPIKMKMDVPPDSLGLTGGEDKPKPTRPD